MKYPSSSSLPTFSAAHINDTIERALLSAGLDTTAGPMRDVTETIRRALSSAGLSTTPAGPVAPFAGRPFVDIEARVVDAVRDDDVIPRPGRAAPEAKPAPGSFVTRHFASAVGERAYKLYVPAQASTTPLPVVVMLHGCTQSADDFATGTRMNRLADEHGFLVIYPEQPASANPSKCWNWFKTQDQVRDGGEPSLVAGIVQDVIARHGADARRVFVAGLSAGAAMAVVLGETHPELFSGVGVHSGLPYGSAHDIPSALAAMKAGKGRMAQLHKMPGATQVPRRKVRQAVPMIVFHGDRDHTVQHANGVEIVQQASDAHAREAGAPLQARLEKGAAPGGRAYSRTVFVDTNGHTPLEAWTLHGAGHAWSGGDAGGSYTDGSGPDASAEMVRFFLSQPRAGSA